MDDERVIEAQRRCETWNQEKRRIERELASLRRERERSVANSVGDAAFLLKRERLVSAVGEADEKLQIAKKDLREAKEDAFRGDSSPMHRTLLRIESLLTQTRDRLRELGAPGYHD